MVNKAGTNSSGRPRACHATWKRKTDANGKLIGLEGSFPNTDTGFGDARAALAHLKFCHWVKPDHQIAQHRDSIVIALTEEDGLTAYEEWLISWNKLPLRKKSPALAFEPLPEDLIEKTIGNALTWEYFDTPMAHSLATTIDNPKAAFQIAFYFHKKGYMDAATFLRLNEEVKYTVDHKEKMDFRIAIPHERINDFTRQFPDTGKLEPNLNQRLLREIAELSTSPNSSPDRFR